MKVIPWNVHIVNSELCLTAHNCSGVAPDCKTGCCGYCYALRKANLLEGIQGRILDGIHENATHLYQPIAGLVNVINRKDVQLSAMHVVSLNTTKSLRRRTTAVMDHKRFLMALASNKVQRVHAVVAIALRGKMGIHAIIDCLDQAAKGLYKPKSYSKEEKLRLLLMLKMGNSHLAEIAHHAYSDPSVSTVCQLHISDPLTSCTGRPMSREICANIASSFPSSGPFLYQTEHVQKSGFSLMIDKVKVKEQQRWDPATNKFIGLCCEHSSDFLLEFATLEDLEQLDEGLQLGQIHRATEVRVYCEARNAAK
jgi:hypothetical protein